MMTSEKLISRRKALQHLATGSGALLVASASAIADSGPKEYVGAAYHPVTGEPVVDATARLRGNDNLGGKISIGNERIPLTGLNHTETKFNNDKPGVNIEIERTHRYQQLWPTGKTPNRIDISVKPGSNISGMTDHIDGFDKLGFYLEEVGPKASSKDIRESAVSYITSHIAGSPETDNISTSDDTCGGCGGGSVDCSGDGTCTGGLNGDSVQLDAPRTGGEYAAGNHGFHQVSGFGVDYDQIGYSNGSGNRWHLQSYFPDAPYGYCGGAENRWAYYRVDSQAGYEIEFDNWEPRDNAMKENWSPSFSIGVGVYGVFSVGVGSISLPIEQPYVDPHDYDYVEWSLDMSGDVPKSQDDSNGVRVDVIPRVDDYYSTRDIKCTASHDYVIPDCRTDHYYSTPEVTWIASPTIVSG